MKQIMKKLPVLGPMVRAAYRRWVRPPEPFHGSDAFWKDRYALGGDSGVGSFGRLAEFKAEILNDFVRKQGVESVIEFGCGDGNQLALADYSRYAGYDISPEAIHLCREKFRDDDSKTFATMNEYRGETAQLSLSVDVIYHLVEDAVYEAYMMRLFDAAEWYVVIYSSNRDEPGVVPQVRHRMFTDWITTHVPQWRLREKIPNRYPYRSDYRRESFADFYIFDRGSPLT